MFDYLEDAVIENWWASLTVSQKQQYKLLLEIEISSLKGAIVTMPSDQPAEAFKANVTAMQDRYQKLATFLQQLTDYDATPPSVVTVT